jgi:hypothetical protein
MTSSFHARERNLLRRGAALLRPYQPPILHETPFDPRIEKA